MKVDYTGVIRPMTKADKAKWVEDLRTTTAPQGAKQLCRGDEFCCLGRANKVLSLGCMDDQGTLGTSRDKTDVFLPSEIQVELYRMNDGLAITRKTFPEIADYIEQNVPAVDEVGQ